MGVELITIFAKSGTKRLEWVHPKGKADEGGLFVWAYGGGQSAFEETEALKSWTREDNLVRSDEVTYSRRTKQWQLIGCSPIPTWAMRSEWR